MPPRVRPRKKPTARRNGADVYLSSVNAIAETGEILNIDGTGNRVAATLYGHKKLYLVTSINKIAADYDAALWRAAISPAPKTPSVCKKRPPAPYAATNATIVPALIASAVAW